MSGAQPTLHSRVGRSHAQTWAEWFNPLGCRSQASELVGNDKASTPRLSLAGIVLADIARVSARGILSSGGWKEIWSGMNVTTHFRPKLLETLKAYSARDFGADAVAGLTVGIVALPLAMAFAIASGVKPEAGIFTAVIAGFIISALGGTRICIGGPTGAFVVILYGIGVKYGLGNLAICTVMAGVILLLMGLARLGTMIKFIPYPVTMGFTSGIAVLIFTTQIKDFFGLQVDKVPSEFVEKMKVLAEQLGTFHWPTLALAVASFAVIKLWPRSWQGRVPGSIVALLLGTIVVALFHIPVATIGTKFNGI